jgi:rhodanese-related sulfurtransferase
MKIKILKISLIFLIGLLIISVNTNALIVNNISNKKNTQYNFEGYINITPEESWLLLNNISNGIQYPIDVRTNTEWMEERIDTPFPEFPRFFTLSNLQTQNGLNNFKSTYKNKEVIIYCKSGGRSASAAQYLVDNEFNGTIYNIQGGITSWKLDGFPTKINNIVPNIPEKPSIEGQCLVNRSCFFNTISNDTDDDPIKYGWDWNGDDIVDEWTEYFSSNNRINISQIWNSEGIYEIKVLVEDIVGEQSDFSLNLEINVENLPPEIPNIEGPTSGKKGKIYQYNISTNDPNNDKVYYWIEWYNGCPGINWEGPYLSGETILKEYSWENDGTYIIRVKTKDTSGEESEWATLEVKMPKYNLNIINKIINSPFLENSLFLKIIQKLLY